MDQFFKVFIKLFFQTFHVWYHKFLVHSFRQHFLNILNFLKGFPFQILLPNRNLLLVLRDGIVKIVEIDFETIDDFQDFGVDVPFDFFKFILDVALGDAAILMLLEDADFLFLIFEGLN